MIHEPNLGMMQSCTICGRRYWCDDGSPICGSITCEREALAPRCEECDDIMEEETESGLCLYCEEDLEEVFVDEEFHIEEEKELVTS